MCYFSHPFDGLVQDCSNTIANALELLQSSLSHHLQVLKSDLDCSGLNVSKSFHLPDFQNFIFLKIDDVDGLVQNCRNSSALAMELQLSCIKSPIYDL